ncbi:hypothetical protein [Gordonia caeni]
MRSGTTLGGESWSVRRRLLAWRPAVGHGGFGVESVHWIDQTLPLPDPDPVEDTCAAAEREKPTLLDRVVDLVNLPGHVETAVLLPLVLGLVYVISGLAALVATPFVLTARVLGAARWCVDVRIDGVLVDMRFARTGAAADRLIGAAAEDLQARRFRTELESAQPVLTFPDHDIGPDDLAG